MPRPDLKLPLSSTVAFPLWLLAAISTWASVYSHPSLSCLTSNKLAWEGRRPNKRLLSVFCQPMLMIVAFMAPWFSYFLKTSH